MFATSILGVSIILQFLAAGLALNMIRVTGRRRAWIFIAAALTLMGVRRTITFTDTVLAGAQNNIHFEAELVALTISVLMLAGVILIGPMFKSLRDGQADLKQSEERFRRVFEETGVGMASNTLDGIFMDVNQAFADMLGYSREELVGKSVFDVTFPEDMPKTRDHRAKSIDEGRQMDTLEKRFLRKDGSHFWGLLNRTLIRDADGNPDHFESQIQDIDEQRQTQEQLLLNESRLQSSQELTRIGYFERDMVADTYFISDICYELYGFPVGSPMSYEKFLSVVHPGDQARVAETIAAGIDGGAPYEMNFRVVHANGEERVLESSAKPLLDSEGNTYKNIGAVRDVTESEQQETILRQSQKMDAVGQLTAGIAHDFNNILSGVIGNLELMRGDIMQDTKNTLRLDRAITSVKRGAELTDRLLAFSRQQSLDVHPLDVIRLIQGMEDLLRRTLGENIDISMDLCDHDWLVNTDAQLLESAILNLAINARDSMPDGGRLVVAADQVNLGARAEELSGNITPGEYLVIQVSDTGMGIPLELLDRVFDPFFTTKEFGRGSGLGLSMVHGFVRQTGGDVQIQSIPGKGTTLTLYLPRSAARAETAGQQADPAYQKLTGNGECVVVVEDDKNVREVTVEMLSRLGYDVLDAGDGKDLETVLDNSGQHIDLVLSDIVLANGSSGAEIAKIAIGKDPSTKILFMTGYAEHEVISEGNDKRRYPVISKPFTSQMLVEKIAQVLAPVAE